MILGWRRFDRIGDNSGLWGRSAHNVMLSTLSGSPPRDGGRLLGGSSAVAFYRIWGLEKIRIRGVQVEQARGKRVEVWFADETRIGQKNSLTRVWGQTGSWPLAPKDLGFASA